MKPLDLQTVEPGSLDFLNELPSRCLGAMKVDLSSIAHNFQFLQANLPEAACSAVVKADAYGLGMVQISPTLAKAGCKHFFVATIDEGIDLRNVVPEGNIYVLSGLLEGTEEDFRGHNLTPVLNDLGQIKAWASHSDKTGQKLPAIIHLDTGMWRLGLPPQEVLRLANEQDPLKSIDLKYIMSHLACSDAPHHEMNLQQKTAFDKALSMLPKTPASLANSHGMFLGQDYQYQLVRPGRSIYGLGARFLRTEGLQQAQRVYARVLQVNAIGKGQTVGYFATYNITKPTRIATIGLGYADGYVRNLSNHGRIFISGYEAPVIGRVSMDLITVDIGEIPEHIVTPGTWAEVIGENISADDVAMSAGTISREITSRLGSRLHRIYV